MSRPEETERLQDLGRASIQIVHDLKNQLNGLKLYATFLRRRIEKSERPGDEQETIGKLIAGLDRAADDLSTIVQYGQPIELKKQPALKSTKCCALSVRVSEDGSRYVVDPNSESVQGNFDHFKLTDAFKWLCGGAMKHRQNENGGELRVSVKTRSADGSKQAVDRVVGLYAQLDHDPFRSFAGSDEIRLALAAKIIEAHGGSAKFMDKKFVVALPLADEATQ